MSGKCIKITGLSRIVHFTRSSLIGSKERLAVEARFSTTGWRWCLTIKTVSDTFTKSMLSPASSPLMNCSSNSRLWLMSSHVSKRSSISSQRSYRFDKSDPFSRYICHCCHRCVKEFKKALRQFNEKKSCGQGAPPPHPSPVTGLWSWTDAYRTGWLWSCYKCNWSLRRELVS